MEQGFLVVVSKARGFDFAGALLTFLLVKKMRLTAMLDTSAYLWRYHSVKK